MSVYHRINSDSFIRFPCNTAGFTVLHQKRCWNVGENDSPLICGLFLCMNLMLLFLDTICPSEVRVSAGCFMWWRCMPSLWWLTIDVFWNQVDFSISNLIGSKLTVYSVKWVWSETKFWWLLLVPFKIVGACASLFIFAEERSTSAFLWYKLLINC